VGTILRYHPQFVAYDRLHETGYEPLALADSLATRGAYADPFLSQPTGPSAHFAPGFPLLVAGLILHWGDGPTGALALKWAWVVALGLQLALLPFLARALGMDPLTGALAAALWLFTALPVHHMWETSYAAITISVLSWAMYAINHRRLSFRRVLLIGGLWGLLLLIQPGVLLVLFLWLFILDVSWQKRLVLLAVAILTIAPWLARNYRVFGRPVYLRDNLGLELAVSNNGCSSFAFEPFRRCFETNHPNVDIDEATRVSHEGEVEYNSRRLREALAWIAGHPRRFALLTAERFAAFWLPPPIPGVPDTYHWQQSLIVSGMTALSIPGMLALWRKQRQSAEILFCWLVAFPPIYYFVQFNPRYREPILWISFLCACYFVFEVLPEWLSQSKELASAQQA